VLPLERLASNLRYLRGQAKSSQEIFSEAIKVELRYYQRLEGAEKKSIQLSTLQRIADAVDLEVWELLAPGIATRNYELPKAVAARRKASKLSRPRK
jgi:transcriptional regulator with XRE-family HTH domain